MPEGVTPPGPPRQRGARLAPFRDPSFRLQWPADVAASWAFEIETLVLGWYVLTATGSVVWLTAFGALQFIGTLISPMFGVMGDRIGHRTVLCAMRASYAVLAAALAAMALTGTLGPWQVLVVATLAGLVRPSDIGMRSALIGATMPPALLVPAMGIARTSADSARVVGALAGAGLVATLGMGLTYVVITLLYLLSLALTSATAAPARTPRSVARSPWRELADGIGHLRTTPVLLATVLLAFLVNFAAYPFSMGLLPYVAREVYGIDRTGLGWLVASFAAGGLAGSLLVIWLGAVLRPAHAMVVACLLWFPLLVLFGATVEPASGMTVMAVTGFVQSFAMVPMSVILLRCAEERFRGRVMGLRILAVYGLPLGLLLAGPLVEALGFARAATGFAGFGLLCTVAIAIRWRRDLWPLDAPANGRRP